MQATDEFTIFDAVQEPQSAPSLSSAQAMAIYELLGSYNADTDEAGAAFVIFTHDQWWQPTLKVSYEHNGCDHVDPYYINEEEPILQRMLRVEDDAPYTLRLDRGDDPGWVVVDDPYPLP